MISGEDMKFYRMDSGWVYDDKVIELEAEHGYKGLLWWLKTVALIAEKYSGDPKNEIAISNTVLQKVLNYKLKSRSKVEQTWLKMGIKHVCTSNKTLFAYPKFLEKQSKFSTSVGRKGFVAFGDIREESKDIREEKYKERNYYNKLNPNCKDHAKYNDSKISPSLFSETYIKFMNEKTNTGRLFLKRDDIDAIKEVLSKYPDIDHVCLLKIWFDLAHNNGDNIFIGNRSIKTYGSQVINLLELKKVIDRSENG